MALNIKDSEAHELARELAEARGTSLTEAVRAALKEALERTRTPADVTVDTLDELSAHCASLPVRDTRTAEDILGYDEAGLPR